MDVDDLPDADALWWAWAVLAATHASLTRAAGSVRLDDTVLVLGRDGHWLRMQRLKRGRALLWSDAGAGPGAAPEWAATEAVRGAGFVAWFAHGEWDTGDGPTDPAVGVLLEALQRPDLKALDPAIDPNRFALVAKDASSGRLEAALFCEYLGLDRDPAPGIALLSRATRRADLPVAGAVQDRLRDQIYQQMRETDEVERIVAQRPALLVRWARIAGLSFAFEYAVVNERGRLTPALSNRPLPSQHQTTLANLLLQLLQEETGEESGAWLFARVMYDGRQVTFDRHFDSWPPWFTVPRSELGPTLAGLAWEMGQRSPQWRPAWASLLPPAG